MSSPDVQQQRRRVSAEGSLLSTVRNLWAYMWPAGRADLKLKVVLVGGETVGPATAEHGV